jgi:hypothetical protein
MIRARGALAVIALILGTLVVWYVHFVVPAKRVGLLGGDLFYYWLPSYSFEAERLRAGALPWWNPYQAAGVPFLATLEAGALYPARLLLLLTDVPTAMEWSALAHVVLAVVATYLLCRSLGATRAGASAGAVVYGGTFGLQNVYLPAFLEGGVWLPVAALALVRIVSGGGWRWVVLCGVAMGMPGLAGSHQIGVFAAYGIGLLMIALFVERSGPDVLPLATVVRRLAVAALIAVGTAAPQILPTLLWSIETSRPVLPLGDLAIDPVSIYVPLWATVRATFVRQTPFLMMFYLSAPVVVLAAVGVVTRGRFGTVLGLGALATYVLALGPRTPFFVVYRWLPGLSMFRFPSRLSMLFEFLAALLVAVGTTWLAQDTRWRRSRQRLAEGLALALVVVGVVGAFTNATQFPWNAPAEAVTGPPQLCEALARFTGDGRAFVAGESGLGPRRGTLHRIRVLQDQESLSSRRLEAYLSALYEPPPVRDEGWPFNGAVSSRARIARPALLDLLAVRTLVLRDGKAPPPERVPLMEAVASIAGRTVWRNPSALPRAYTVGRARFVADETAALATLTSSDFDGHEEAVVIGPPVAALEGGAPAPFTPAQIVIDDPERVAIDVRVDRPSLLVLADAFAPGWRVRVGDEVRPLLQVNHYVRGVLVEAGDRHVEFSYTPPGLVAGLVVAILCWITALAVVSYDVRRPYSDQETHARAPRAIKSASPSTPHGA